MASESPFAAILIIVGLTLLPKYAHRLGSWSRPCFRRKIQSPTEVSFTIIVLALLVYNLWTLSPFSVAHRQANDVFRRTGLPIGCSSASLRAKLATISAHDLGLQSLPLWEGDGEAAQEGDIVERLISKLGSMAARQLYLQIGPSALLECYYCKQPTDLALYSLIRVLTIYIGHLIAFGILTMSPTTLARMDRTLSTATDAGVVQQSRMHSHAWRKPCSLVMLVMIVCEAAVMFDYIGWGDRQISWWNHWQYNTFLFRHILLLALTSLIYLYPSTHSTKPSSALQIATTLAATQEVLSRAASSVALAQAGRQVIWQDPTLRELTLDYHASHVSEDSDIFLTEAVRRGVLKPEARNHASGLVLRKLEQIGHDSLRTSKKDTTR